VTAFAVAALLGLVCLLAVLSREDRLLQEDQWAGVLSTRAAAQLADLRARYEIERAAADASYALADTARAKGDTEHAILMLGVGYRYLAGLTRDRRAYLRELALYSRLVSAIVPLPPLAPRQFRLGELRTLAGAGHVVHYLLVAAAERFRLRVWTLAHGFALAVRALVPTSRRIPAARADYATLEGETLRSAEALVEALATVAVAAGKARA
jgi:hypothetical protein